MVNSSGFSKENMVKESGHFADFQKSVVDPGFQEESVLSSKKRRQSYSVTRQQLGTDYRVNVTFGLYEEIN